MNPQVAHPAGATLGEGPVWDERRSELVWVDIVAGLVHRYRPGTGALPPISVGQAVGAVLPREARGYVLAVADGIALLDGDTETVELVAEIERDIGSNRMNDAACDPAGRLWAGTMAWDATPRAGALYRIDTELRVTLVLSGVTVSNGLDWSPDAETMYYADSAEGIDAFDFAPESGAISNRRRLVTVPSEEGIPDGLTVDKEGFLWVAIYNGGQVRRYSPQGRLERTIELPIRRPTSCAFGGEDYGDLFITSAHEGPDTGHLWLARPGVRGRPPSRFGG